MSLIKKTDVEKNVVELEISVDAEAFEAAVAASYKKNIAKVNIPGFRRGKAPRKIVEKMYGEGFFWNDAIDALYPDAYESAVKEAGIEPVGRAEVEIKEIGADKGFTFTAKVPVKPEITLGEYKGIEVEKAKVEVTDADIDAEVATYQNRNMRIIDVDDRAAQKGDVVTFDFKGFVDGKAFEGGEAKDYRLPLGSGQFIPGFEDQMEGKKIDEDFSVNVTFPEDYQAEELKGKAAEFKCCIHKIQIEELPEVDDEFVKDVSDFDTVADFRDDLKKKVEERKANQADRDAEDKLVEKIAGLVEGDIPQVMFDNEIDASLRDFEQRMAAQGMSMKQYMELTGAKEEDLRNLFAKRAQTDVRLRLALEKIAATEGLKVTEEEIDAEYDKFSKEMQVPVEKIKNDAVTENIVKELEQKKALDFVKENAKYVLPVVIADEPAAPKKKAPAKKKAAPKAAEEAKAEEAPAEEAPKPKKKAPAKKKAAPKADAEKSDAE